MATISNTPRPGYVYDSTDAVWYPIGTGSHNHSEIPSTIVDAKGDIITASAADTPARLAVGNNGETLVADSSTSTGLRYTPQGLSNPVINGGMDIWQRGTSFTVANTVYLMDRWYNTGDTSLTVTRDTDVPTSPYFNYSAKLVGTGTQSISQRIESVESTKLVGQIVTISLYAKKTSGTGALGVNLYYPSATDNFASVTQIGSALEMSANPGSSWTRYSVTTSALPADVQKGLLVLLNNTNTHTIFITGVQIDVGSVALPFRRAGGTIQGELAACQRYFQQHTIDVVYGTLSNYGTATSTTSAESVIPLKVTMRIKPATLTYANLAWNSGVAVVAITSAALAAESSTQFAYVTGTVASGLTQYRPYALSGNNNAAAYIGISAEL